MSILVGDVIWYVIHKVESRYEKFVGGELRKIDGGAEEREGPLIVGGYGSGLGLDYEIIPVWELPGLDHDSPLS